MIQKNIIIKGVAIAAVLVCIFSSCGPKIGDALVARDEKNNTFYQTWDGKIHEFSRMSENQYFTPGGADYMIFDGEKIKKVEVRGYQTKKGYYFNRFGNRDKNIVVNRMASGSLSDSKVVLSSFAQRLIKGKIDLYFAITAVDQATGSRGDYFFRKGDEDQITPLRTFTLKDITGDCKQCKSLLEDAVTEYEGMPKWRKKAADSYVATEKKLSKLLVDVINEYNTH